MAARPGKSSEAEIAFEVSKDGPLAEWSVQGDKLHRLYKFADFTAAFGFMAQAALVADKMDHHPEWFNVYSTVRVHLTTHDAGGVTALDFTLARAMEAIAARLPPAA